MIEVTALWLPIVVSAAITFLISNVMHVLLPFHRGDTAKLPDEDALLAAMRERKVGPGDYMFPYCTGKEMRSDAMAARWKQGPVGFLTVMPEGAPAIGKSLVQWFVYMLAVSLLVGYTAGQAFGPGTDYRHVFRMTSTAAFLVYALGGIPASIWKGQKWSTTFRFALDGLVYALFTGGAFGWLWPA